MGAEEEPSAKWTCHRCGDAADTEFLAASKNTANIVTTSRDNDFDELSWWVVDLTNHSQGATALVKRCMRTYGWDGSMTRKVLAAYRQFIILKKELKDWNANILSPCHLVEQMWHCHILDVVNYCHDMMLLCGRLIGHNPDGALDYVGKKMREEATRVSLLEHFGSYDEEIWKFSQDMISIHFRAYNKRDITINAHRTDTLGHALREYKSRIGRSEFVWRFEFIQGKKQVEVHPDLTPESLQMTGNDLIYCYIGPLNDDDANEEKRFLTVGVKDQNGEKCMFRIKRTTQMRKLFRVHTERKGMHVQDCRFMTNGEAMDPNVSAAYFNLKDNDIIDCI